MNSLPAQVDGGSVVPGTGSVLERLAVGYDVLVGLVPGVGVVEQLLLGHRVGLVLRQRVVAPLDRADAEVLREDVLATGQLVVDEQRRRARVGRRLDQADAVRADDERLSRVTALRLPRDRG